MEAIKEGITIVNVISDVYSVLVSLYIYIYIYVS